MIEQPLYACTVDGEPMQLDILEAAYLEQAEGRTVTVGARSGERYLTAAANFAPLDRAFQHEQ